MSKLTTGRHYRLLQVVPFLHTFLGLLAKIKCSICSLEFDNSNGGHCPPCYLTYFSGGLPNSDACIAGLAAWPWHCTTALAEHPLINNQFRTCLSILTDGKIPIVTTQMSHFTLYVSKGDFLHHMINTQKKLNNTTETISSRCSTLDALSLASGLLPHNAFILSSCA